MRHEALARHGWRLSGASRSISCDRALWAFGGGMPIGGVAQRIGGASGRPAAASSRTRSLPRPACRPWACLRTSKVAKTWRPPALQALWFYPGPQRCAYHVQKAASTGDASRLLRYRQLSSMSRKVARGAQVFHQPGRRQAGIERVVMQAPKPPATKATQVSTSSTDWGHATGAGPRGGRHC